MSGQESGFIEEGTDDVVTSRPLHRAAHWTALLLRLLRHPSEQTLNETRAGRILLARFRGASAAQVLQVLDALAAGEVPVWLAGGWGVDALVGHQSRLHGDIDLVVDAATVPEDRLLQALAGLGFVRTETSEASDVALRTRWLFRGRRGRVLDVLPVAMGTPPFHADALSTGRVLGQVVPCLSAAAQRAARTGYTLRAEDRRDLGQLGHGTGSATVTGRAE